MTGEGENFLKGSFLLQSCDLGQPALVALFVSEIRPEECFHQILGKFDADNARSENQDVHVVVLNALMSGIAVMANCRPDADQFVGGNTGTDPAAADQHTTFGPSVQNGTADGLSEIGVVGGIFVEGADIQHRVTKSAQNISYSVLEGESRVV